MKTAFLVLLSLVVLLHTAMAGPPDSKQQTQVLVGNAWVTVEPWMTERGYDKSLGDALSVAFQNTAERVLMLAVPKWIEHLRTRGWSYVQERAKACADVVAYEGDNILYRTKGKTARAFNHLAEGIACAAFCPGGVRAFGLAFEAHFDEECAP